MNKIEYTPRGFPFDSLTLKELQDFSLPFIDATSKILPNRCRLYGVVINAYADPGGVTDGFIYWDGELLPFKGGELHSQFSIMQEVQNRTFNVGTAADPDLEDHPAYTRRWAEIGNLMGAESVHNISALNPVPKFLIGLRTGSVYIGTAGPVIDSDGLKIDVVFPNIGTSEYVVLGTFTAGSGVTQNISYLIKNTTATGFRLHLTNVYVPIPFVFFKYVIIPQ